MHSLLCRIVKNFNEGDNVRVFQPSHDCDFPFYFNLVCLRLIRELKFIWIPHPCVVPCKLGMSVQILVLSLHRFDCLKTIESDAEEYMSNGHARQAGRSSNLSLV